MRINRDTIKSMLLSVLCFMLISCSAHTSVNTKESFKFPIESFTKIKATANYKPIQCTPPEGKPDCSDILKKLPVAKTTSLGSGSIISVQQSGTYVLTAAHVCHEPKIQEFIMPNGYKIKAEVTMVLIVIDWLGEKHVAVEIDSDIENDICILRTPPGWGKQLQIAESMPELGDRVYNMAAPYGIFGPKRILMFEGFYSGKDIRNVHFFTTPTRPGSSGSPILNYKGEVVSVIHSAMRSFENVGLGCDLTPILSLMGSIPPDTQNLEPLKTIISPKL